MTDRQTGRHHPFIITRYYTLSTSLSCPRSCARCILIVLLELHTLHSFRTLLSLISSTHQCATLPLPSIEPRLFPPCSRLSSMPKHAEGWWQHPDKQMLTLPRALYSYKHLTQTQVLVPLLESTCCSRRASLYQCCTSYFTTTDGVH